MHADIVSLKPGPNGGLDVPKDAYILLFELAGRDLIFSQEGEMLRIKRADGGRPEFLAGEVERIKKWKMHLLAMLAYQPPTL